MFRWVFNHYLVRVHEERVYHFPRDATCYLNGLIKGVRQAQFKGETALASRKVFFKDYERWLQTCLRDAQTAFSGKLTTRTTTLQAIYKRYYTNPDDDVYPSTSSITHVVYVALLSCLVTLF